MRIAPRSAALLTVAMLAGTAACGSGDDSSSGAGNAIGSYLRGPAASAEPDFQTGTRPVDGGTGSGNGLTVTGVRLASHGDFDRVVFDLDGTGTPGWYVNYAKRARADGSGKRVPLKGSAIVQVTVHGVGYPTDTGVKEWSTSTTRVSGSGTAGIAQVAPGTVFEGSQVAFIGLKGTARPFRVFALRQPTRLVVDVRHP